MGFRPQHVLAPVAVASSDDATLAERLVDAACDLLQPAGTDRRLTIAYVDVPMSSFIGADTLYAPASYFQALADLQAANRAAAEASLLKLKQRAEERGVPASTWILEPIAGTGEVIASAARERGADLIVLWSHGRRGLKRLFLGSVAERVAHVASVPVLILRTSTNQEG